VTGRCIWVSLPYATFGLFSHDGKIIAAAPIAGWTVGRSERDVAAYFRRRGAVFRDVP
jgi:hypothetical protein